MRALTITVPIPLPWTFLRGTSFLPFRTNTSENREITRARVRVASSTDASARNQRALYSLSLSIFFSSRDRYQRTRATGANCEHCKPILRIARCRGRGADNGMMEVGGGGGGGGGGGRPRHNEDSFVKG